MIKIKLGELIDAEHALTTLAQSKTLPFKAAFHIGRVLRKTAEDRKDFYSRQNDLIEQHGEPQYNDVEKDGKKVREPATKPDGTPLMGINPQSPGWPAFEAGLKDLHSTEIECADISPLSIEAMGDQPQCSPLELASVLWLFKENDNATNPG